MGASKAHDGIPRRQHYGGIHRQEKDRPGCPRDAREPHIVIVNQGTNEPGLPGPKYTEHYVHYLGMIRAADRKAMIVGLCPLNDTP